MDTDHYNTLYRAWRTNNWLRLHANNDHPGVPSAIAFMRAYQAERDGYSQAVLDAAERTYRQRFGISCERFCMFHSTFSNKLGWILGTDRKEFRTARDMQKAQRRRRARIAAHAVGFQREYGITINDWRTAPEGKLFERR